VAQNLPYEDFKSQTFGLSIYTYMLKSGLFQDAENCKARWSDVKTFSCHTD